jgi:hypothetical protein
MNIVLETPHLREEISPGHKGYIIRPHTRVLAEIRAHTRHRLLSEKYGVVEMELSGRETETLDVTEGPGLRAAQLNFAAVCTISECAAVSAPKSNRKTLFFRYLLPPSHFSLNPAL